MAATPPRDSPRALPPPFIYGPCFLLGWGLERLWPLVALPRGPRRWAGGALILLGLALGLWALAGFLRHRTSLLLHRPAAALITTGAFALSRNPAYAALTLLCAGLALWLGSLWALAMTAPAALLTDCLVIRREEAYLERRFGEAYRAYRARVRRWV